MEKEQQFFEHRPIRRFLIIALVLAIVVVESVLEPLSRLVHWLIAALGLQKLEDWLKRLPLWCAVPITLVPLGIFIFLEFYQYVLLAQGLWFFYGMAHFGKWLVWPLLNYILHLYGRRFYELEQVRWVYHEVYRATLRWLRHKPLFTWVMEIKGRVKKAVALRLANLRETWRQVRESWRHERSLWAAARRLKNIRLTKT